MQNGTKLEGITPLSIDAVGWVAGIQPVKKLSGGMLAWLCVWVKVQSCIWLS